MILGELPLFHGEPEFCKDARSKKGIIIFMGSPNRSTFERNVFIALLESGKLLMTRPESPKAPDQKYYTNPEIEG